MVTVEIEWRGSRVPTQLLAAQAAARRLVRRLEEKRGVACLGLALADVLSRGAEQVGRALSNGWDEPGGRRIIGSPTPPPPGGAPVDETAVAAAVMVLRLRSVAAALRDAQASLSRMSEGCRPEVFYNEIRPFLAGWKSNPSLPEGMVYGDLDGGAPRQYYGGSAAQSSLLQSADAGLGIAREEDSRSAFLRVMRDEYMPRQHAAFLRRLEGGVTAKTAADAVVATCSASTLADTRSSGGALVEAFNVCVSQVAEFRSAHMGIVGEFIMGPQSRAEGRSAKGLSGTSGGKGTGGTDLMTFLRPLRDNTWRAGAGTE